MKESNLQLAREWTEKGENDLQNAEVLLREGGTIDAVCFHCQQAVETYLKAFLVYHGLSPRKIHSLVALAKDCSQKEERLLDFMEAYKTLEAYYIESRYPPDTRVYAQEEGEEAYHQAREIIDYIKSLLLDINK